MVQQREVIGWKYISFLWPSRYFLFYQIKVLSFIYVHFDIMQILSNEKKFTFVTRIILTNLSVNHYMGHIINGL